ncbi:MAG TPA: ABC transporter ATP-binding protein, partial [Fibrobacteria bacterium]|nr:ABC transporter ATP-binding protein [Fibrobacteria bacterium]
NIIEIRGLTKDYALGKTRVRALRGVDLDIARGDLVTIMGPSGSGKTTLLNIIGCIDYPTSGSVKVSGRELGALGDKQVTSLRLHHLGFIFQTFNLIPVLTSTENVEFPLLLQKELPRAEIRKRAEALLDDVGLAEFRHHRPAELSGGQRQRVAIARALVTNPDIVLADEPTANLDSETGASILEIMTGMNRRQQTTFLFSTHDKNVLKYARTVVNIVDGRIAPPAAA